MEWLDADGSGLSVFRVHHGRRDSVLIRQAIAERIEKGPVPPHALARPGALPPRRVRLRQSLSTLSRADRTASRAIPYRLRIAPLRLHRVTLSLEVAQDFQRDSANHRDR